MLTKLLKNHVLANLTFVLILAMGTLSYLQLPRQQDPEINFNWIDISTFWPGASAEDVEKLVTDPIEDAVAKISDIRFVSSNSREGFSSVLIRFDDIDDRTFDKRINDLRREIQNSEAELPTDVLTPHITEITTANAFPTAMVIITGKAADENLRRQSVLIKEDLERLQGINNVTSLGLSDPEIQVNMLPDRLLELGISPSEVANTVALNFRDLAAGSAEQGEETWLVRMVGTSNNPEYLARLPLISQQGEILLEDVAKVERGHEKLAQLVSYNDQPSILLGITKKSKTNILDILERVNGYVEDRNRYTDQTGIHLILADDQTIPTRHAIDIMQNNALIGLGFVVLVTWLFLGTRISLLVSIGIPFILAATFWILAAIGQTLNQSVLLGVVISLGMLVDDAVVMAEAIYYRLQRGYDKVTAALHSLNEIFAPITSAVLTTIAAFLPLMLLPGILGKFMMVIPLVVTIALAISLIEAYWMLPAHVIASNIRPRDEMKSHHWRWRMTHTIRVNYTRLLIRAMRWPKMTMFAAIVMFIGALGAMVGGAVKMDFFASDPLRFFYISIEMSPDSSLEQTHAKVQQVEGVARKHIEEGDARAIVSYAGQMFTETAPYFGDHYGQVMVSLNPEVKGMRGVDEIMDTMRSDILAVTGAKEISFVRMAGGPPTEKPIKIKVRGENYTEIAAAAEDLKEIMRNVSGIKDISDDSTPGRMELQLRLNHDSIRRAGLMPDEVRRALRLLVDGEIITSIQDQGEKVEIRVRADPQKYFSLQQLLHNTLPLANGSVIALDQLVHSETRSGAGNLRHYNFRRAITVEADINKEITDEVKANRAVLDRWATKLQSKYPNLDLDTSGVLDDIEEALGSMLILFMLGVGLMYLILGTQFGSYFQPMAILATIPLAFTGVVLGLLISRNPMSLYTLYGIVALAGIAVNSAIVLISAANDRLGKGMSLLHATLYAARRRVIPILITSLTTVAGLFSLATGLGGKSLVWGPVATAIVWGLAFSTVLTLFVIPLIYRLSMGRSPRVVHNISHG